MLLGERDDDPVIGGSRLQLEIEGAAEALAERQPPRAIDTGPEGSVQDQLHPPAFIKETLGDYRAIGRDGSQGGCPGLHVSSGLFGAALIQPALSGQELNGVRFRAADYLLADARHLLRQLDGTARRFAIPERNGRSSAVRIFHAHPARLHAPDPPGCGAEQEHIARQALDCEIFVEGTDYRAFRFRHHLIICRFRNGSAGGDRGQASAAPAAHTAVHLIAMQESAATSAHGGDPIREHRHDRVEIGSSERTIGINTADERVQIVFAPILASRGCDDLLGQNIQRVLRNL